MKIALFLFLFFISGMAFGCKEDTQVSNNQNGTPRFVSDNPYAGPVDDNNQNNNVNNVNNTEGTSCPDCP
ncbi:hypothetical protein KKF84_16200, partial [Myxococcota bacterium]|nr:hypothetical protein [Myxococcota bacterium]MBU1536868.1 hypothetical protein [Myxococcota bacterium]